MNPSTTLSGDECSPWPPALQFTPEVESGLQSAAALAFGPFWDTPMSELTPEMLIQELRRHAEWLMEMSGSRVGQPL